MIRSPPSVRSSTKAQRMLSASDKRVQRSQLMSSEPETATMAGSDNKKTVVDSSVVAQCVNNYLSGDEVFEKLVDRLTSHMSVVIDRAVRSAMSAVNEELANLRLALREMEERLMDRTDELEQYQRRNNLRIFGLKETRSEDTDALVVELCREKLGLDIPENALCRSHRVGKQLLKKAADGRELYRPIIVRFISYRDRRNIYGAKKKLKGTGITIREDLTKRRAEVWKAAVAVHGMRNTWTRDGRVLWVDGSGKRGMATRLRDLGPISTPDFGSLDRCPGDASASSVA